VDSICLGLLEWIGWRAFEIVRCALLMQIAIEIVRCALLMQIAKHVPKHVRTGSGTVKHHPYFSTKSRNQDVRLRCVSDRNLQCNSKVHACAFPVTLWHNAQSWACRIKATNGVEFCAVNVGLLLFMSTEASKLTSCLLII